MVSNRSWGTVWIVDSVLLSACSSSLGCCWSFHLSFSSSSPCLCTSISPLSTPVQVEGKVRRCAGFTKIRTVTKTRNCGWEGVRTKYIDTFLWGLRRDQLLRLQFLNLSGLEIFILVLYFHGNILIILLIMVLLWPRCFLLVCTSHI